MAERFIGGADLSGKKGYAVKGNGTDKTVVLATDNADCAGILVQDNTATGGNVGVALVGEVVEAMAGGTFSCFGPLKADSAGKLVAAGGTGDDNVIAIALEDGTATSGLVKVQVAKFIK